MKQYPEFPEEVRTAAQLRQLHRVTVGSNTQRCPVCHGPLSVDLSGNPFCRGCHRKTLVASHNFKRRYEL